VVLESALDLVVLIGMPVVEARIRALATHAKTELQDIRQVEMKTNMEPSHSGGVIKFRLHNVPTKRAYDTLWERYRTSIAMTASGDSEGLPLSPHIYNSTDQIDRAVAAVRGLAQLARAVHLRRPPIGPSSESATRTRTKAPR
jgi:selenocysteine lyase/cysteine desulfurase